MGSRRRYDRKSLKDKTPEKHRSSSTNLLRTTKRPVIEEDKEGFLICSPGSLLQDRFKILSTLGEGALGRVHKVHDVINNRTIALKVIKNVEKHRDAAKLEIKMLKKLSKYDPSDKYNCVKMLNWFDYHGHTCIGFGVLGSSTYEFMKENNYLPYPLEDVRNIVYQLCNSVNFLHRNKITHTDLKPENILFYDSSYKTVHDPRRKVDYKYLKDSSTCLIDFGSAIFDHEHHGTIVQTRQYRAPEVILELGWSRPCDIWSIGCILFELAYGFVLFQTHSTKEHLAMIERVLGTFPVEMAKDTKVKYFDHEKLLWTQDSSGGSVVREYCKPLKRYLPKDESDRTRKCYEDLLNLISKMLMHDPNERIGLDEAMNHPFFQKR